MTHQYCTWFWIHKFDPDSLLCLLRNVLLTVGEHLVKKKVKSLKWNQKPFSSKEFINSTNKILCVQEGKRSLSIAEDEYIKYNLNTCKRICIKSTK